MTPQDEPVSGQSDTTVAGSETEPDVLRLRAERDAARSALERERQRRHRQSGPRRVVVGFLVVLFALLLPLTLTITWAHQTVLNTDRYVSTVTPIASDPAVTAAVSRQVTDQLYTALDPQAVIAKALPPKAAFLAGPIANGARSNVQAAVDKVLQSSQFQQLWVTANRTAHATLVTVLRGDSKVLQTTDGQVVINLVPLLNQVLASSSDFVSGVVGRPVTLPVISKDELPSVACERISAALDRPLPTTCGQIALFPSARLANAQRAVRWFDRGTVALLVVTPLVFLGALAVSRRRRRTLLQLSVGGVLGLVVVRRAAMWEQSRLADVGRPENKEARTAIVDQVLNGFFTLSLWFVVGGLVVVVLALVSGPYPWAVAGRRRAGLLSRRTGQLVAAGARGSVAGVQDPAALAWFREHFEVLRLSGVAVAVVLLLVLDVSFLGFLALAAVLALYEVGLYRVRPPDTITLPPSA